MAEGVLEPLRLSASQCSDTRVLREVAMCACRCGRARMAICVPVCAPAATHGYVGRGRDARACSLSLAERNKIAIVTDKDGVLPTLVALIGHRDPAVSTCARARMAMCISRMARAPLGRIQMPQ